METRTLLLGLALLLAGMAYYYGINGACKFCPDCGLETPVGVCEDCPHKKGTDLLKKIAVSCNNHLRAVIREDMVNADNVLSFLNGGEKRLVLLSNIAPENMINIVETEDVNISKIKVLGLSASIVDGKKYYIVLSIIDNKLDSTMTPTTVFEEAFKILNTTAREQLGSDMESLVFYIDEAVACSKDQVIEKFE